MVLLHASSVRCWVVSYLITTERIDRIFIKLWALMETIFSTVYTISLILSKTKYFRLRLSDSLRYAAVWFRVQKMKIKRSRLIRTGRRDERRLWLLELLSEPKMWISLYSLCCAWIYHIKNKEQEKSCLCWTMGRMCRLSTVLAEVIVGMAANEKRALGPKDQYEERIAQRRQFP